MQRFCLFSGFYYQFISIFASELTGDEKILKLFFSFVIVISSTFFTSKFIKCFKIFIYFFLRVYGGSMKALKLNSIKICSVLSLTVDKVQSGAEKKENIYFIVFYWHFFFLGELVMPVCIANKVY